MVHPQLLFDNTGRPVSIGRELGSGGEGAVFELAAHNGHVAKIYHKPVAADKSAKLSTMARRVSAELLKFTAWPTATLHPQSGGPVVGFVMPKVAGYEEIHRLYGPAHREKTFPDSSWAFLIRTAINCAAAFDTVHARGHVIGDVNGRNVVVSQKALVQLLDCDSFQISENGRLYYCEVGVEDYTPPELQGKPFSSIARTPNHDAFGLAVIIFQLLFMARHPFSGRYHGKGEMTIEKAIQENRFAYSSQAMSYQMSPPPHSLTLSHLPSALAGLFERAFSRDASQSGRPRATEWAATLTQLETKLGKCSRNPGHVYYAGLAQCPWCGIAQAGGPDFFATVASSYWATRLATFNLEGVWKAILAIPAPDRAFPELSDPAVSPTPLPAEAVDARKMADGVRISVIVLMGLSLLSILLPLLAYAALPLLAGSLIWMFVLYVTSPYLKETERRKSIRQAKAHELGRVRATWTETSTDSQSRFSKKKADLQTLKEQFILYQGAHARARQELENNKRRAQLDLHLKSYFIVDAEKIPKIGPGRRATLASYGVETAFDIQSSRIDNIPGFGPAMTRSLLTWRYQKEADFHFDPSKAIPQAEIRAIDGRFSSLKCQIAEQLLKGPEELDGIRQSVQGTYSELLDQVRLTWVELAQAKADASVK